ncbi:diaminopimelate epimerase [Corynebacterium liangguodongii]|uniref:Diaminopimelate epimerase n=1 Tax=Corynebacterium liangguodongii TaxID=2079535 RepID=A0A2S0WEG9_9CORY|nr:diaminopimelate epimerase [Corynebacterium liangguodongii]AWB84175.1 diaminopimelate epimerase [Corynebacterium liangguodongii]PWC00186.1 diaminopimelate epimerase [Corynebacterium liangguodongii]
MNIEFLKAHGTENDFVVIVDPEDSLSLSEAQVAALCDRRAGIGGDGLLRVVERDGRWFMDYRNADGSIAEMCGNGVRVFAHVLVAEGLVTEREFDVDTRAGLKHIEVLEADSFGARVRVGMGSVEVTGVSTARMGSFAFAGLGVDVGNPHLAAVVPGLSAEELSSMRFEQPAFDHDFFPDGVNVEVLTELAEGQVHMRVWERGVGETRSCGTGTVAAARAALADAGIENGTVTVNVPGGAIEVELADGEALMTGPSRIVARGTVTLPV